MERSRFISTAAVSPSMIRRDLRGDGADAARDELARGDEALARLRDDAPAAGAGAVAEDDRDRERRERERRGADRDEEREEKGALSHVDAQPFGASALGPSRIPACGATFSMRIARVRGTPDALLLDEAARCVASGGTLVFPTDTVYGIGCAAENDAAVESIFAAKRRPADKPLAVHLASPELAGSYATAITPAARALIAKFWPGPLSIVVARRAGVCSAAARGGPTISLRCPDDDVCRAILAATGPLAATSANISGSAPYDGGDDMRGLPDATLAVIAGPTKRGQESTVLDCSTDAVRLIREGALEAAKVEETLSGIAPFSR